MRVSLHHPLLLLCGLLLVSCAHQGSRPLSDRVPFAERLVHFQSLHNSLQVDELRAYFTRDARIQSPLTPRASSLDKYLNTLKMEPYDLHFSNTELVYSLPRRAATRSDVVAKAPGRFDLKERVIVDWRVADGYWRISRILFSDWSPIVGTWRRGGIKQEGTIELRILPTGNYLVYLGGDYSEPAFRGRYQLQSSNIVFADTGSKDLEQLQRAEGSYRFVRTATGMDLHLVQDENSWRAERFEGLWTANP